MKEQGEFYLLLTFNVIWSDSFCEQRLLSAALKTRSIFFNKQDKTKK